MAYHLIQSLPHAEHSKPAGGRFIESGLELTAMQPVHSLIPLAAAKVAQRDGGCVGVRIRVPGERSCLCCSKRAGLGAGLRSREQNSDGYRLRLNHPAGLAWMLDTG